MQLSSGKGCRSQARNTRLPSTYRLWSRTQQATQPPITWTQQSWLLIAYCPQPPDHCPDAPLHLSRYNIDVLAPPGSAQAKSVLRATYVPLLGALRSPRASHLSPSAARLLESLCALNPFRQGVPPSSSTLKGCTESRQLHPGKRLRWHGSHPPPPLPIELTNLPTWACARSRTAKYLL